LCYIQLEYIINTRNPGYTSPLLGSG